jgi:DNA-binding NtrC family response regulator
MANILIIDDDPHMRLACARVLTKAGHTVACTETGEEGLAKISGGTTSCDLVLLDQLMPGMSGMEVLVRIREAEPLLPVIIMSGSATEETAQQLRDRGACGCLPKPFNPEQLRTAVKNALSANA